MSDKNAWRRGRYRTVTLSADIFTRCLHLISEPGGHDRAWLIIQSNAKESARLLTYMPSLIDEMPFETLTAESKRDLMQDIEAVYSMCRIVAAQSAARDAIR